MDIFWERADPALNYIFLFVVLVIFLFGFHDTILVLILPVPGHCLLLPLAFQIYNDMFFPSIFIYFFIYSFQAYMFLGHMCMTYALAFLVSLAFESPMMGLEKALLGREKNS